MNVIMVVSVVCDTSQRERVVGFEERRIWNMVMKHVVMDILASHCHLDQCGTLYRVLELRVRFRRSHESCSSFIFPLPTNTALQGLNKQETVDKHGKLAITRSVKKDSKTTVWMIRMYHFCSPKYSSLA